MVSGWVGHEKGIEKVSEVLVGMEDGGSSSARDGGQYPPLMAGVGGGGRGAGDGSGGYNGEAGENREYFAPKMKMMTRKSGAKFNSEIVLD